MKRLLLLCALSALVAASVAEATATTTFAVSASSSRAAVPAWTTNRDGNLTMTLTYSGGKNATAAFNVWATAPGASLNGLCTTATSPGRITYSCVDAPASGYETMIWPSKGTLSGTLTVVGETD